MAFLPQFAVVILVTAGILGVAGQNICLVVALLAAMASRLIDMPFVRPWWKRLAIQVSKPSNRLLFVASVYLLVISTAIVIRPWTKHLAWLVEPFGFGSIIWCPLVCLWCRGVWNSAAFIARFPKWAACVVGIWAAICLSQAVWGWHFVHGQLTVGSTRANGLMSHPLSAAYAVLIVWPWAKNAAFSWPRSIWAWVAFLGAAAVIWTTESRTVQGICLVSLLLSIFTRLKGRTRLVVSAVVAAGMLAAVTIDSPVARKIQHTLSGSEDRQQDLYADDRVAFWHANFLLFLDHPILGHGQTYPGEMLDEKYDAIGLKTFEKKYGAHNMYLSTLVHEGIVGLLVLLLWYILVIRTMRKSVTMGGSKLSFAASSASEAMILLAIGGMTQNALQDSAVRYVLGISVGIWISLREADSPTI